MSMQAILTLLTRALTGRACPCKRASKGSRGSTMVLQSLPLALQCLPMALPLRLHPQQLHRVAAAGMVLNMSSQKASANRISAGEATPEQLINLCDFGKVYLYSIDIITVVAACIIFTQMQSGMCLYSKFFYWSHKT